MQIFVFAVETSSLFRFQDLLLDPNQFSGLTFLLYIFAGSYNYTPQFLHTYILYQYIMDIRQQRVRIFN